MSVKVMVTINNAPSELHKWTVVRRDEEGQLWYYGTYVDKNRAQTAVAELNNGILLEVL